MVDGRAERLAELLTQVPRERTQALPALHLLHDLAGHLSLEGLEQVAGWLRVSKSELYAVATSYTEFRLDVPAPDMLVVCSGLSCRMAGSSALTTALRVAGRTVEERECFFYCAVAPVAEIAGAMLGRASVSAIETASK